MTRKSLVKYGSAMTVVDRLRKTPDGQKRAEGKRICIEIIQQVREIEGVHGVHLMAYRQEELVAEIVEEAGLLPRPQQAGSPHSNGKPSQRREREPRVTGAHLQRKDGP